MKQDGRYFSPINGEEITLEKIKESLPEKIPLKKVEQKSTQKDNFDMSILENSKPSFNINKIELPKKAEINVREPKVNVQKVNPVDINATNESHKKLNPYSEYLDNMAKVLESPKSPDVAISSSFTVIEGKRPMCYHQLEKIEGDSRIIIQQEVFPYNLEFKEKVLEPAIKDYAKRSPMEQAKVVDTPENNISHFQTFSTNNNVLSINNIETSYAHKIDNIVKNTPPNLFKQQITNKNMVKDPVLTRVPQNISGYANSIFLSLIIGFGLGLLSWLIVFFYYHQ